MKELYISVDVETTGPIPSAFSMFELGACVVGNPDKIFFRKLKLINDHYIPDALDACGWTLESLKADLEQNGINPLYVMREFENWVSEVSQGRQPVFVGFNATFDWSFINWYFYFFLGTNPFGIGGLDIKAYCMGMMDCAWRDTTKKGFDPRFLSQREHTHRAVDDAKEQADIFLNLLNYNSKK